MQVSSPSSSASSQQSSASRRGGQQRRHRSLQQNPLDVLHEVWHDAANQHASSVVTDCIKPPPSKKGKGGKGSSDNGTTRTPTAAPSVASSSPTTKSGMSLSPKAASSKSKKGKYCEEGGSSHPTSSPNSSPSAENPPVPALRPNPASFPTPPGESPVSPTRRPLSPSLPGGTTSPTPSPNAPPTPGIEQPVVAPPPTIDLLPPSSPDSNPTAPSPSAALPPTTTGGASDRCQAVADETLVTGALNATTLRLNLGLRLEADVNVETALQQLQVALQTQVAPLLTNCQDSNTDGESAQERHHRHLQESPGLGQVENVVFGPRSALDFVDCQETFSNSLCLNSGGRVTAYGPVESRDFGNALQSTISNATLNVTGLQAITSVQPKISSSDLAPVPEGSGNDRNTDDGAPPAIVDPPGNVSPGDGKISAGAAVGIALAALIVLLVALFAIRHRRNRPYDRRDALKLAQLTEDDEDDLGATLAADPLPASRKVHVLGEDDSLLSGNRNALRGFGGRDDDTATLPTIEPVTAVAFATSSLDDPRAAELVHDHYCASPHCDVCDARKRNHGVRFVATATPISPSLPLDARRSYVADDTVLL